MIKFTHKKEIAFRFTLDIRGNIQEYALSFLRIVNNAREYPETIYKVENTKSSVVYVVCDKGDRDSVRDFLSQFGEIQWEEDINYFHIVAQYDTKGYDEIYADDNEVEFVVDFE